VSKQIIYIGLDDTDNLESRGTGNLARQIASQLATEHELVGVTRHQLLLDDRIAYTAKNSSAAICLRLEDHTALMSISERARAIMLSDLIPGSDPGLCVATEEAARRFTEFGQRAQRSVVTQAEARALANQAGVLLDGLGGSQDGVIGALAAVGLAAWGNDGRYILAGGTRNLQGLQPIQVLIDAGISSIHTLQDEPVQDGLILSDKLRPARRHSRPVLFVEWDQDHWLPLKID
jgi:hypothetical protein